MINSKKFLSLGLMSGTSADGIDIGLLKTDGESYIKLGPTGYYSFSKLFSKKIKSVFKTKMIMKEFKSLKRIKEIESEFTELNFKVIKKHSGWKKIRIKKDGYIGYIKNNKFPQPIKPNFKVSVLKASLFSKPKPKKKLKQFLPYESRLRIVKKNGKFAKFENHWIKISDLKKINFKHRNIFKDITDNNFTLTLIYTQFVGVCLFIGVFATGPVSLRYGRKLIKKIEYGISNIKNFLLIFLSFKKSHIGKNNIICFAQSEIPKIINGITILLPLLFFS